MTSDEEAEFTALVQRQSRFVFRVAYAVLLNSHDAEDAVQETFLKLYRNSGWRHVENEQAFLARVALARGSRSPPRPPGPRNRSPIRSPPIDPPSGATRAGTNAGRRQSARGDSRHDRRLPEELRLPLVLSASEELNSREIAAILRIPEGTVRTRLQRARQALRLRLAKRNAPHQETQHA